MKIIQVSVDRETIVPVQALVIKPELEETIRNDGILVPVVMAENLVIDGVKRVAAAKGAGVLEVPAIEVAGDPWKLRWQLNLFRTSNLVETSMIYFNLNESIRSNYLEAAGIKHSPAVTASLKWIAGHPEFWPEILEKSLPFAIFREMAGLPDSENHFLGHLLRVSGSVGEKRIIAGLFRQMKLRKRSLDTIPLGSCTEMKESLLKAVEPRRTGVLERWNKALGETKKVPGLSLEIDPTLENTGINVSVRVKRGQDKLTEVAEKVRAIFNKIPEL